MMIPPPDLLWLTETFLRAASEVREAWEESGLGQSTDDATPELLIEAMSQLLDLLRSHEAEAESPLPHTSRPGPGITELGEYGLNIINEFARLSVELGLGEPEIWEQISLSLCRWVAEHDGELDTLQLAVNALARLANYHQEQRILEVLHSIMCDLIEAALPPDELEPGLPPSHTFHMLLINRAIVATRTLSPECMERAFEAITLHFPDQAPQFFSEGELQAQQRDYPEPVREVIHRYASSWPLQRTLH